MDLFESECLLNQQLTVSLSNPSRWSGAEHVRYEVSTQRDSNLASAPEILFSLSQRFVYAEVNADEVFWLYKDSETPLKLIQTNTEE